VTVEQTRKQHSPLALKKKAVAAALLAQESEIEELMARFCGQHSSGDLLQKLEPLIRTAVFKPAKAIVGLLLQQAVDAFDASYQPKPGQQLKGRTVLQVQCLFGFTEILRDYTTIPNAKRGTVRPTRRWAWKMVTHRGCSVDVPGRRSARCFQEASNNLDQTGGVKVSGRQIQRMVQRIGSRPRLAKTRSHPGTERRAHPLCQRRWHWSSRLPSETKDRQGKATDGKAATRQAYLGCVFSQHRCDDKGHPVRDPDSTTYVSSLESIDEFGPQLRQEALRRGLATVAQIVLLIDGAVGLANMGLSCFSSAVQIVDFYHAMVHAGEVLLALHGPQPAGQSRAQETPTALGQAITEGPGQESYCFDPGSHCGNATQSAVTKRWVISRTMSIGCSTGPFAPKDTSSVRESWRRAANQSLAGACKQSGMRWSVRGAENILAFRCIQSSRRLDQFWKHHLNARAAQNDHLQLSA